MRELRTKYLSSIFHFPSLILLLASSAQKGSSEFGIPFVIDEAFCSFPKGAIRNRYDLLGSEDPAVTGEGGGGSLNKTPTRKDPCA